jgi:hypothetical protein
MIALPSRARFGANRSAPPRLFRLWRAGQVVKLSKIGCRHQWTNSTVRPTVESVLSRVMATRLTTNRLISSAVSLPSLAAR